jgi:hypothetical protein
VARDRRADEAPGVGLRGAAPLTGPVSSGAYGRNRCAWESPGSAF